MRYGIHGVHDLGTRIGNRATVRNLLIVYLRALDSTVFGEPDAFAWVQGWQIGRRRLLSRRYRDARFAFLIECGLCRGEGAAAVPAAAAGEAVTGSGGCAKTGTNTGMRCSLCDGTGRLDRR